MLSLLVLLTGLMGGIYLAFSAVIIKSLNDLPGLQAAQAMNSINDVIVNTVFMPIFFGTTLWYAGLIVWSFADWQEGTSTLIVCASAIYIVGMFFVTAFGNVPMNNQLKILSNKENLLVAYWSQYQRSWTQLNHIRSISCLISCTLLICALT